MRIATMVQDGDSALILAAQQGHEQAVACLLQCGNGACLLQCGSVVLCYRREVW
jgi:hypothetical protein